MRVQYIIFHYRSPAIDNAKMFIHLWYVRTKNNLLCSPAQFTILISISEVNNYKSTGGNINLCARPVYTLQFCGGGVNLCHAFNASLKEYFQQRIRYMWNLIFAPVQYQARGISVNRKI